MLPPHKTFSFTTLTLTVFADEVVFLVEEENAFALVVVPPTSIVHVHGGTVLQNADKPRLTGCPVSVGRFAACCTVRDSPVRFCAAFEQNIW